MGRKSKRRGGKSKRGGNRPSPNNNAHGKIPDDLISLCQITKAFGTLMLAEMGHVEDEKDSSILSTLRRMRVSCLLMEGKHFSGG